MWQPERGAAVPKFGDWDESNPASADGYTHIFNKVREERQGGTGNAPGTPQNRPYVDRKKVDDDRAQVWDDQQFLYYVGIKGETEMIRGCWKYTLLGFR